MDEKKSSELAKNTVEAANVLVSEDQALIDADKQIEDLANMTAQQARILAQADGAMENAFEQKPFTPPEDQEELFDEIDAEIETMNAMDEGVQKANRKWGNTPSQPDTLKGVIEQVMEEAREKQGEEDLEADIINGLENNENE